MNSGQKLCVVGLFSALVIGCGTSDRREPGGVGGQNGEGGAGGGGGAPGTQPQQASIRVAHLSPGTPPVDICLRSGREAVGPIMGQLLQDQDGLAYGEVTRYLQVPAKTYTIRLVQPGARDCQTPLEGTEDAPAVELIERGRTTAVALGQLGQGVAVPFEVKTFRDEAQAPAGKALLRFIHAAPGAPNVDVGLEPGTAFRPLYTDVKYGEEGAEGQKRYREMEPIRDARLVLRAAGTTRDILELPDFTLRSGEVVTAFAIGVPASAEHPLQGLACVDSAQTSASGQLAADLARCTRMTP